MKTAELTGPALDWAVAKAKDIDFAENGWNPVNVFLGARVAGHHRYSTDWPQGGPIIEREGIATMPFGDDGEWLAVKEPGVFDTTPEDSERSWEIGGLFAHRAENSLTAAMRCYVASKLGDEVEIPKELM